MRWLLALLMVAMAPPAAADISGFSFNGGLPPEPQDAVKPPPEPPMFKPLGDGAIEPIVPLPETFNGQPVCQMMAPEELRRQLAAGRSPRDFTIRELIGEPGCISLADMRQMEEMAEPDPDPAWLEAERNQLLDALQAIGESIAEPE